ncbi:MAG: hypothetical protein DCO96_05880 [Fluviicola sp. XM-24bin1]|nr:MAG: hypothetical protein DCO96_05880 [Fluviicola sp. XM-24bin1]
MKRILIISYFYPESAFVGGQRTHYWAENLHKHGYYPIVVTRNWNKGQTTLTEEVEDNEAKMEKFDTHEVHRLPFEQSTRDKMANKPSMRYFQKALTVWELIASNFRWKSIPYNNFYPYCSNLVKNDSIDLVLISGRPFQQFYFGYLLKKKFNVPWVADYRDEWNSHYRIQPSGVLRKMIASLERKSEKKWISNASAFITVSEAGLNRLESFTNKPGYVVKNGFDSILDKEQTDASKLKILYAGTLYPYQDLSIIEKAIIELNDPNIEFHMIGGFDTEALEHYYMTLVQEHPNHFKYAAKVPKESFEKLMQSMDIGVLTPYKNLDGCLPVKTYDYYAAGLKILLCRSDNDLMERFIQETESGVVVESVESCKEFLLQQLELKESGGEISARNYDLGREYSRAYQTEILAKTLDSIVKP